MEHNFVKSSNQLCINSFLLFNKYYQTTVPVSCFLCISLIYLLTIFFIEDNYEIELKFGTSDQI